MRALNTTFSALFRRGYAGTKVWWPLIATLVPSSSRSNTYGWMQSNSRMREFVGEREFANLVAQSYVIENKTFEKSVEVSRDDIEDDNLGVYNPLFEELGMASAKNPDYLLADLLKDGHATLCHDEQYFFDTDHPVNPKKASLGVLSNAFLSKALTATNFEHVRAQMMSWVDEGGNPRGIVADTLFVPPALEAAGERIVMADKDASGADNVNKGKAKLVVMPELAGQDTTWYLACCNRPLKPLIYQQRRGSNMVRRDSPTDECVFKENKAQYGIDQRENAGYGLWWLAAKASAEASFP
jgi:phage major head subunit gpT-like protein